MAAADPDTLISEFFRRLDELEALAHEITGRLTNARAPEPQAERPFDLVLMCTGNRVRSPVAEGFLRTLLDGLPVRVSSVGTLDLGAVPPLPEAIETAAALGLDISAHRARCVLAEDLSAADVVVGFEQRHIATAVVDSRAPRERTFTMGELVALLDRIEPPAADTPVERARQAVARAHALRRSQGGTPAELPDPLGGSAAIYRETITTVRELSRRLAAGLFGETAVQKLPELPNPPRRLPRRRRRSALRLARENA